ncbi:DsrE family protein [Desulfosediminicola flagellatus]|uniref:DsrE family protein n=1 Tax=Desulfosediminicola flagellatus TaxID=2569541 RepID=UPI0010ACC71F|nr:DsrE family protein [Desulfosediminicola flagellatus]
MEKIALVAYTGELMCFSHVMLYALDYAEKGHTVSVIIEGAGTKLITDLAKTETPFAKLYSQLREKKLIGCICKACSVKMGTYDEAVRQGLAMGDNMSGHPSLEQYTKEGYVIMTF